MSEEIVPQIGEAIKGLYLQAEKDDPKILSGVNVYPQLRHRVNKHLIWRGSNSYRVTRLAQTGILRKTQHSPFHTLDVKDKGYEFARLCGVRSPVARFSLRPDELRFDQLAVTKPMYSDGGKCIYAWDARDDEYFDYFSRRIEKSEEAIKARMQADFIAKGVKREGWVQEEIIVGVDGTPKTTHDVKFYAFYGEIQAVLQVDRWDSKTFAFFDAQGKPIDTGVYPMRESVVPVFSPELVESAKRLSLKIPWPHVRLDFLVSDNDFAIGEFTSNPGSFADFNDEWDTRLAKAYQGAFGRLYQDFLRKKDFPEYNACFGPF